MKSLTLKFVDAKERLPKKSGDYVVLHDTGLTTLSYSTKYKAFNTFDAQAPRQAEKTAIPVLYWASNSNLVRSWLTNIV